MYIGDIFSAIVEKLVHGGEGLANIKGKRVFIPFTAPGDLVEARITEDHGSWARAELCEINEPSPLRTEARCPHYGTCGGCSLQHLSYEAQLEVKKTILAETLQKKAPAEDFPSITVVPSSPWEYRNRVSLHRAKQFSRCGFKARKSEEVIPLTDCPAADPGIRRILPSLLPPPGKDRFTVYSKGETLIAETGTSIAENGLTGQKNQIQNKGTITLMEQSLGRNVTLEASSFFQSNAAVLEKLIGCLRITAEKAADGGAGKMADLYSGVGTFSLFLADLFSNGIDLLETDTRALNLAKMNLTAYKKTFQEEPDGNFRFFSQKDEQWAKKRDLGAYSFVVVDPPRQGLSPALAHSLCRSGPPVFDYVSCEPASFSRDYNILSQNYILESLTLFDFYPQTAHIECMGIFIRK